MSDFLKMDIFFSIAAVATVAVTLLIAVVLLYVIRLLRTLDRISKEIEAEAKLLRSDIADARSAAREQGSELKGLFSLASASIKRLFPKKRKRTRRTGS